MQWDDSSSTSLEKAANGNKPIVVLFPNEKTDVENYLVGKEFQDMKDAEAVFITVTYTSDRAPAPGGADSIVPTSRLTGDNPYRDYKIGVGQEVLLVLDCHGNYDDVGVMFTRKPSSKQLKDALALVPTRAAAQVKKIDKNLESANKALEKGDRNNAFKSVVKVLESGLVGYNAVNEAARLYNSICDEVRSEIAEIKSGDAKEGQKKLSSLAGVYTKRNAPALASEIADAKKELKS